MTIRKLASIQEIDRIAVHTNADSLELAYIGGWQVVVKKGEFQMGDLVIYCEIDSILPERPEFEFLRSKHFRIKTIKLRGALSQGIIFPLSILDGEQQIIAAYNIVGDKILNTDVTEKLGITKYETEKSLPQGDAKGNFPPFIPKTDEQRVQSAMHLIDEMQGLECYITVKEDGTSFTAYINNGIYGICSRNLELKTDSLTIYNKISKQYDIENKLRTLNKNVAIQGEITGSGIQGNPLDLPVNTHQLHIYNIYDIDEHRYLDYDEYCLDLPTVETIYRGPFTFNLEQLLEMAKGTYVGTRNKREGIVIRPIHEKFSNRLHGRLSFKTINNEYLLGEK